jgi:hypothetical protein
MRINFGSSCFPIGFLFKNLDDKNHRRFIFNDIPVRNVKMTTSSPALLQGNMEEWRELEAD